MTFTDVKMESATNKMTMILYDFDNMVPQSTAIGIQANMKNLYISQTLGVNQKIRGIKNMTTKELLSKTSFCLMKDIIAIKKGIPKFNAKYITGFPTMNVAGHIAPNENDVGVPPLKMKGKAKTNGTRK